jgi:hypothetical protein
MTGRKERGILREEGRKERRKEGRKEGGRKEGRTLNDRRKWKKGY